MGEQFAVEALSRPSRQLHGREQRMELAFALSFTAVAVLLAVAGDWNRGLSIPAAAVLVLAYATMARIQFAVAAGCTVPTQLVFVPMLFALPLALVPVLVALGFVLAKLPDYVRGGARLSRAIVEIGDSWHSLGPVAVLSLAADGPPDWRHWPIYLAALGAQFAVDMVMSVGRERAAAGLRASDLMPSLAWVYLVDALLAPIGLLAAFAASEQSYAFLLALPLAVLLGVFARERRGRIEQALELSRAYRRTAVLLGDVVGADDVYTGEHSRGVVDLAVAVAEELGVNADDRRLVEFGALLHDVGKIRMPKSILHKPGPLTGEEWAIMRTHTNEGQRMLDRVGGGLREVGVIVRASHERYDGSGYPDGLVGDRIPLAARIVSCADAYSAMTTDRPYRAAMTAAQAVEELRANAGTQFDPRVVDALVAVVLRAIATGGGARRAGDEALPSLEAPARVA